MSCSCHTKSAGEPGEWTTGCAPTPRPSDEVTRRSSKGAGGDGGAGTLPLMTPIAVEAQNLVKSYGVVRAVDGVSFQVQRGEIVGFLGANGAGKTTTLRMLCGLLTPTSGRALIDGFDIHAQPIEAQARLCYLDEQPFVHPHPTGREILNYIAYLDRMPRGPEHQQRMERLLGLFALADLNGELRGA